MNLKQIDACGRPCPEPVVMAQNAISENPEGIEILVDNICAVENVTRFATNAGYSVQKALEGPDYRLTLVKK
jgi:tRNA 2-thiouridine synthesizing protein A